MQEFNRRTERTIGKKVRNQEQSEKNDEHNRDQNLSHRKSTHFAGVAGHI